MSRSSRLFDILQILRDGDLYRAQDLATRLGVSVRTIYRDMETLAQAGVPVEGTRGTGYRSTAATTLPPLTLSHAELEALNLGIAIVGESADPDLKAAAFSLAEKFDAVLPVEANAAADAWKFASHPFAEAARAYAHMPTLRAAIKARQKLRLRHIDASGAVQTCVVRPLQMEHWGRVWALTTWCEQDAAHRLFRIDLIDSAEALPELFADEPGKTLADFRR